MTTTPNTPAETKAAPAPAAADDKTPRYCAYDNTYLRFIGDVQDSKSKVTSSDAYKDAKKAGHDVEVREV